MKQALQQRIRDGFDIASSGYHGVMAIMRDARYGLARGVPYSQNIGYLLIEGFTSN